MFEFLTQIATDTAADKATEPKSREALTSSVDRIKFECTFMKANLSDDECRRVWTLLGLAYEIGTFSGFLDEGVKEPAESIRGYTNQKKSVAKRAEKKLLWQKHALDLAIKARKKNGTLSQQDLAQNLESKKGWPDDNLPSRSLLIQAIRGWEKSGELPPRRKV
ncbi:hypothetical protein [Methylocapsa palsarum]|nr:hypothetical protein [Methylocapsa palsarum]